MAFNADQELKLIIKSVYSPEGAKTALGDLRLLVEATNRGSKEAAAALDHWRASYGKLRSEMATGGSAGGQLATDPAAFINAYRGPTPPVIPPPVIPQQGGALAGLLGNYGSRRHLGAIAGQALGIPGLGIAAATGGIAGGITVGIMAVERFLQVVKNIAQAWHDASIALQAQLHQFDTFAQRVDTVESKTMQLAIHNKNIAEAWKEIPRQVNSVAAAVQHVLDLETERVKIEGEMDDLQKNRQLEEVRMRTMFNPIERLREEEKIEEEFFQRKIARERELDEVRKASIERQRKWAEEQEEADQARLASINKILPKAQHEADVVKDQAETQIQMANDRFQRLEKERLLVERLAQGQITPMGIGLKAYAGARAEIAPTEGLTGLDALMGIFAAQLGNGFVPFAVQQSAKNRLTEIEGIQGGLAEDKQRARDAIRGMQGMTGILERRQQRVEGYIEQDKKLQTEADRDAANTQELINQREAARQQREATGVDTIRLQEQRQEIESMKPANVAPSGGTASLDDVVRELKLMNATWS